MKNLTYLNFYKDIIDSINFSFGANITMKKILKKIILPIMTILMATSLNAEEDSKKNHKHLHLKEHIL
jgi:hypothetical protein